MAPFDYLRRTLKLFKDPQRNSRPAKLRDLRAEIREAQLAAATPSPISAISTASPGWSQTPSPLSGVSGTSPSWPHSGQVPGLAGSPTTHPNVTKEEEASEACEVTEELGTHDSHEDPKADKPLNPVIPGEQGIGESEEQPNKPPPELSVARQPDLEAEQGELTFEDQQAVRDLQYVVFEGEDETDYTAGPSRIVMASDGVQEHCGALLLTLDLSAKIQEVVRAEMELEQAKRVERRTEEANMAFESKLQSLIAGHEHRLVVLKGDSYDSDTEEDVCHETVDVQGAEDSTAQEASMIQEELSKLRLLVENTQAKQQRFAAAVEFKQEMLLESQAELNVYLKEAFVRARLIEPLQEEAEEDVEAPDVETEYQRICRMAQEDDGNLPRELDPLHSYADPYEYKVPVLSPEQQGLAALKQAYSATKQRLQDAQVAFDGRADTRAMELYACETAAERGEEPTDASVEAFDLRWFVRIRELTRALIDAETAVSEARAALIEGGGKLNERDQESDFADHASDGYRMSEEVARVANAQSDERVLAWLVSLPDPADMVSMDEDIEVDADDWDAQSVGVEDSVSVVAEGTARRRIDKWRHICGL